MPSRKARWPSLADAPSPWIAIPGLIVLAVVLVTVSALKIRRMETSYEEE